MEHTGSPFHRPWIQARRGEASLGWALMGASRVAARQMVPAIREQPPLPSPAGGDPVLSSWVVGIFSHSEARARAFAAAHQIPHAFVNLADLLHHPAVTCVYISSHPRHHFVAAMAALNAGKHVLCETPLALTQAEAETLAHTAASRGLLLGINHVHRADPALNRLRLMLAQGAIGDPLGGRIRNSRLLPPDLQSWRLEPNGGGVILDRTLHDLDLLRFLFRDEIDQVQAISTQQLLGQKVPEEVLTTVHLRRHGLFVQLHDSFLVPHLPTCVEIYGSTGSLIARHCLAGEGPGELYLARHGQLTPVAVPTVPTAWHQAVAHFNRAVRGEGPLLASGVDGVQSLVAALAVEQSLRERRPVAVQGPGRLYADRSLV
ncbi:MAG: 1,5-anhydro-D-fructose reductase [Litorilinea sp.]|nr:MAG: 1,5-anhydro-D-fructose reductase [Litorilinea sp.]